MSELSTVRTMPMEERVAAVYTQAEAIFSVNLETMRVAGRAINWEIGVLFGQFVDEHPEYTLVELYDLVFRPMAQAHTKQWKRSYEWLKQVTWVARALNYVEPPPHWSWEELRAQVKPSIEAVDTEVTAVTLPVPTEKPVTDPDYEEEPAPVLSHSRDPIPRHRVDDALRYLHDKVASQLPLCRKDLFEIERLLGLVKGEAHV